MPRDGNGNYSRTNGVFTGPTTWNQQANSADKTISSDRHDTHDEDLAAALTGSLARDGQGGMTGDLNLGNNRITSLADPVADTDAVTKKFLDTLQASQISYTAPYTNALERELVSRGSDQACILDWIPEAEHAAIRDGTTTTDLYTYIANAIADLAPTTNDARPILFPKGLYPVSQTVILPTFMQFHGEGDRQSVIQALPGFTGSQVIQLGDASFVFSCYLQNMRISANDIPGLRCVYSNRIQEKAGLRECLLADFDQTGCFVEFAAAGEAMNYFFQNVEAFPNNNDEISISSLTQIAGVATAISAGHTWQVGQYFSTLGAVEDEYKGAYKITAVRANEFDFAVESTAPATATGTITASRCIPFRFDVGGASKCELYGLHPVKASGPGIGCLIQRARGGVIKGFHSEGFGVGICTGLEASTASLSIESANAWPDIEIGVQLSGGTFAAVNIKNLTVENNSRIALWDSYYGTRIKSSALGFHSTGDGAAPDGALISTGTGAKVCQLRGPIRPRSYTVAAVPDALEAGAGAMIYVTDESNGEVPAFADSAGNWRRVTDRAIIS